ncbi:MAG: hypothetical protein ACR2RL_05150, partial [Gammaproteobacteria bacterium]
AGQGTSAGGAATVTTGASENGAAVNPGASGTFTVTIGAAGTATTGTAGAGGAITLTGAAGGASTGASSTAGAGSSVSITAGAGGASSGGGDTAGAAGNGTSTAGAGGAGATDIGGGSIILVAGAAGGSGTDEGAIIRRGMLMRDQATPQTATDTATLTAAQMTSGILVSTPTAAATYTTLTGTLLEAEMPPSLANDDTFDLTIINLGGAGDIITLAGGTGVSIVGSADVDDAGADITSSGTFRFRRSAANTFIAYRVA